MEKKGSSDNIESLDEDEIHELATEIVGDATRAGIARFKLQNQLKDSADAVRDLYDNPTPGPSQPAAEVDYDDFMARVGSSQSVDDSVLDGFINDVLTKASRPDVAIPWSPSELAAESQSDSSLQEQSEMV